MRGYTLIKEYLKSLNDYLRISNKINTDNHWVSLRKQYSGGE